MRRVTRPTGSRPIHWSARWSSPTTPHARLTRLDVGAAEALPGVIAVFTGRDVPVNEYGLTMADQPVFISIEHTGRSKVSWRREPVGGRSPRIRGRRDDRGRRGRSPSDRGRLGAAPDPRRHRRGARRRRRPAPPGERARDEQLHQLQDPQGRHGDRVGARRCRGRGDLRGALPGTRLPPARGRAVLRRRRGPGHHRGRRPVDPRGPGTDRPTLSTCPTTGCA